MRKRLFLLLAILCCASAVCRPQESTESIPASPPNSSSSTNGNWRKSPDLKDQLPDSGDDGNKTPEELGDDGNKTPQELPPRPAKPKPHKKKTDEQRRSDH